MIENSESEYSQLLSCFFLSEKYGSFLIAQAIYWNSCHMVFTPAVWDTVLLGM